MRLAKLLLILSMVFFSIGAADAAITIGKGDFYVSIGDYDYLPYSHNYDRPRVSFYNMMSQYGDWVYISNFGRAWKPYVYYDWQPFTYGHWSYTQYGPTWVGYEPWAWAAYHYGNWIFTQNYGWVWLPGYEWNPGRVIWGYSYNTIGWSPAPPQGYNYACGYLCRERQTYNTGYYPYNGYQFEDYEDYNDYSNYDEYQDYNNDYGHNQNYNNYNSYDPYNSYGFRYEPYFYNRDYIRIAPRLWTFVSLNDYKYEDYSDIYFDQDFVGYLFQRRIIRVNERSLERTTLERIVRQRITEEPVREIQLQTDRQPLRVVVPVQEEEMVKRHRNKAAREVILPAFVEKRKPIHQKRMDQPDAKNTAQKGQVETLDDNAVLNDAKRTREQRKAKRQQVHREGVQNIERADREGKLESLKREGNQNGQEPVRNQEQRNQKESEVRKNAPSMSKKPIDPAKFDAWRQRETKKFNSWKENQTRKFESWKQENKNKPDELKRAESDFQQKIKQAEQKLQQRIKQAEQENKRS